MTGLHAALAALVEEKSGTGPVRFGGGRSDALVFVEEIRALLDEHQATPSSPAIDAAHIEHQRAWSTETFGPREHRGPAGPLAHIRKEVEEVAEDPTVLEEWVDVIILGFDGAWRAGHEPQAIIDAIKAKQAKNEARTWPEWRTVPADQAIEHFRAAAAPVATDNTKPSFCSSRNPEPPHQRCEQGAEHDGRHRDFPTDPAKAETYWTAAADAVHLAPVDGESTMRCCGRTPFEVPRGDRVTTDWAEVACPVKDERDASQRAACLAAWPEAEAMAHSPACCRFPKSCSIPSAPEPSDRAGLSETEALGALLTEHRPNIVTEEIGVPDGRRGERTWRTRVKCDGDACDFYEEGPRYWEVKQRHTDHLAEVVAAHLADRLAAAEQERGEAQTKVRDYERGITWDTTCTSCAKTIEQMHAAEQTAATLRAKVDNLTAVSVEITQERDALRAQVAAVWALVEEWESKETPGWFRNQHAVALRAALGDSAPVVQRIKDEAVVEALGDLRQRALRASQTLTASIDAHWEADERRRLRGKVEGVNLVLSYLDETERARRVRDGEPT